MNRIHFDKLEDDFYSFEGFEGINSVSEILADVKKRGDEAIRDYTAKFGDGTIDTLQVSQEEIDVAFSQVSPEFIESVKKSIKNVETFAKAQLSSIKPLEIDIDYGQNSKEKSKLGHKIIPLERVGAYVPGGNYPLPSSAIMGVVPAKVAGVKEVIVCSPRIKPEVIVAASLAGADKIFKIGGVQAIAGMAFGTPSIPKVDKIVGPGNKFVTQAKKEVYGVCGIDFLAGPSEVMIIADESANPRFVAADMLAQCEHDLDARAYLVTNSEKLADTVEKEISEFLKVLDTSEIASKSIAKSTVIIVQSMEQAVEVSNKKAPEHLEICLENSENYVDKFTNYGSLFVGNYSAEVFGDYCSGTNHVLPTNGVSRYSGGLSVFDFIKIQTYQVVSKSDANNVLSSLSSLLASTEGLSAHKLSADLRRE